MRASIVWKLTFAFVLVALTTAALVALFIRTTSTGQLSQLIIDQQRSALQTSLVEYYQASGSWDGVAEQWQQIRQEAAAPHPAAQKTGHFPPPPEHGHQDIFGLVDGQGTVIVSFQPEYPVGSVVPVSLIQGGTPVTSDGQRVGTILNAPLQPSFNPEETRFLQRTTEALVFAVLGATLVALAMGVLLARTLTRPLHALTQAAEKIAQGELEQEVKVSSKDELGRLASAFNRMSQEVARVNRLRRQMTADIAHDLRTPLLVIAGYIESMRDGVLQPTQQRLEIIYSEITHLQGLVNDLRMLSQADAGELPLNPQQVSPRELLEKAVAPFMHRAETGGVSLAVEAGEDLPEVRVDEARMTQVFSNLLSNALRYTPEGGQIRLSARAASGGVVLSVSDTGCGIPQEDLPFIFDRFYKVDKARTDESETGLGLAIVKALVEAHGGTVWAESKEGEFSRFNIKL